MDPQTYQQSAHEALPNMTPQDRQQYGQQLRAAADQQGVRHGRDGHSTDPASLAQMTTTVHQQNPGLLGGSGGGGLGALLGGGGTGGGGLGGMLGGAAGGNSIMRSVLGGIAAMAASKMMNRGKTGGSGSIL